MRVPDSKDTSAEDGGLEAEAEGGPLFRLERAIGTLSLFTSVVVIFLILLLVIREVIGRYFFDSPTGWTNEMVGYGVVACGYLGAGYALRTDGLIRVTLLVERLSDRPRHITEFLASLIATGTLVIGVWYSIEFTQFAYVNETRSNTMMLTPLWIPRALMTFGILVLTAQSLVDTLQRARVLIPRPIVQRQREGR